MKAFRKLFTRQNKKQDIIIRWAPDCLMGVFIIAAIYALIFDNLRYPGIALFLIFLYAFRLMAIIQTIRNTESHSQTTNYQQVHTLQELNKNHAQLKDLQQSNEVDNSLLSNNNKKSFLVREYERINDSRFMNNRNANSLNRSKMQKSVRGSLNKIKSPNASMERAGNYLGEIFNQKLDFSIVRSRLSQSFIRTIDAKNQDEQALKDSQKKIYRKFQTYYQETVKNKLGLSLQEVESRHAILKRLMMNQCREVLDRNITNLQQIVKILEESYDIKINSFGRLPQITSSHFSIYKSINENNPKAAYQLQEVLYELINADIVAGPSFPRKEQPHTLTSYPGTSWRDAGLVRENKVESLSSQVKAKIEKLRAERLKLDKMLHWGDDQIKIQNILANIQYISEYVETQGTSNHFIKQDTFKLTEDESKRKLAAMNVMKEAINTSLNNREENMLAYENTSMFGWLLGKRRRSNWELRKESEASNYGHPHYNLIRRSINEEILHCQLGPQNGVSVLYMYLHMQAKTSPEVVGECPKLNELVCKVVGRGVI